MDIVRAQQKHLDEVARLFDLYRQLYEYEADIELARQFLSEPILNDDYHAYSLEL